MNKEAPPPPTLAADLRGASRLTVDAVIGVTDLVETMHRNIADTASLKGLRGMTRVRLDGPATGITGFVYRGVRGITGLVGKGLDLALDALTPLLGLQPPEWPGRAGVVAALNGVLGDHLAASSNPLAIGMALRCIDTATPPTGRIVVLVHGLCMGSGQWLRHGHDHGAALARDLGSTPVYADYNSGLHISNNGRELARRLEALVDGWPVPVESLTLIGHSMGGLVARSAVHYAMAGWLAWPARLSNMIFLGTPHHGAPLERAGSIIDMLLGATAYAAPLARIGQTRSAGIQDLRHGNLVDEHWGRSRPNSSQLVHLPPQVACYAIAAVQGNPAQRLKNAVIGDGLVPVNSALGRHARASHSLYFPVENTTVVAGLNHFDLLDDAEVYACLRGWLQRPSSGVPK